MSFYFETSSQKNGEVSELDLAMTSPLQTQRCAESINLAQNIDPSNIVQNYILSHVLIMHALLSFTKPQGGNESAKIGMRKCCRKTFVSLDLIDSRREVFFASSHK